MGRSIMIVGNGQIAAGLAAAIDAADIVMRFNDCRSAGPGGTRTDIVTVCNTGRPAKKMLTEPGWADNPSVRAAAAIWCVRDPARFDAMRGPLLVRHPELEDFCDDYTAGFKDFAAANGKAFHVIPAATHERLDRELEAFDPAPYVVPSTGLVAIAEFLWTFLLPYDRVCIAGFSHQGWEWHPWDAERRWVGGHCAEGWLDHLRPVAELDVTPYLSLKM